MKSRIMNGKLTRRLEPILLDFIWFKYFCYYILRLTNTYNFVYMATSIISNHTYFNQQFHYFYFGQGITIYLLFLYILFIHILIFLIDNNKLICDIIYNFALHIVIVDEKYKYTKIYYLYKIHFYFL